MGRLNYYEKVFSIIQAAVMLSRLAQAVGQPLPEQAATFADNNNISSWAIEEVGQIQAAGIMGGVGENLFSPQSDYTREQSIVTVLRLYDEMQGNTESAGNVLNGIYKFQGEDYATGQGTITYTFIFKPDGTVTKTYSSSTNDSTNNQEVIETYSLDGTILKFESNEIVSSSSFMYDEKTDTIALSDGRIFEKEVESTQTSTITPQPTPTDKLIPESEISISQEIYRFSDITLDMTVDEVIAILGDCDEISENRIYNTGKQNFIIYTWVYPYNFTEYYDVAGEVRKTEYVEEGNSISCLRIEIEFYYNVDRANQKILDEQLRVMRKEIKNIPNFLSSPETVSVTYSDFRSLYERYSNGEKLTYQDAVKALGCSGFLAKEEYKREYYSGNLMQDIIQTYYWVPSEVLSGVFRGNDVMYQYAEFTNGVMSNSTR